MWIFVFLFLCADVDVCFLFLCTHVDVCFSISMYSCGCLFFYFYVLMWMLVFILM